MKISDFNKTAPIGKPPEQIIQIGDGRKEQAMADSIASLEASLEATETSLKAASLVSKQSRVEAGTEAAKRRSAEDEVRSLKAQRNQLELVAESVGKLRGQLHVAEMATEKAERQARINSAPKYMSQGAIESSTGFHMPGFGSVIPRKHLGGGVPNLVQYRVKKELI